MRIEKMNKPVCLSITLLLIAVLTSCGKNDPVNQDQVSDNIRAIGQVTVNTSETSAAKPASEPAAPEAAATEAVEAVASTETATDNSDGDGDGEKIYRSACFTCHDGGVAGAPKLGDAGLWAPRIEKGMDALLQSAIHGVPGTAMPPRGTCATCSDDDLKAAIEFMVSQVQ